MTEPLIDRDMLRGVIRTFCGDCEKQTDAALAYLRGVLTLAALDPTEWVSPDPESSIGTDLHRRIFGEDG